LRNDSPELVEALCGLPAGTPVAFQAAYGWSWLVESLEDQKLEPHLAHPSPRKAIAAGPVEGRSRGRWRSCCAPTCYRRRGSPQPRCESCVRCCDFPTARKLCPWAGLSPLNAQVKTSTPLRV
jgi:hypothetical protein